MTHFLTHPNSDLFDPVTKRYIWPEGINATGRRMLFTGPDGVVNQRVSIQKEHRYVGIGTMSLEGTSDLSYLYRPSWRDPQRLHRKQSRVGSIGWGIPMHSDPLPPLSGNQITRGEFRRSAEDQHTHMYQNPWSPMPSYMRRPKTAPARGRRSVSRMSYNEDYYAPQPLDYGPVEGEVGAEDGGDSSSRASSSQTSLRNASI